jgi:hypothetical protein
MTNYVWLYNTSHTDYWWLYDDNISLKLELIYIDYKNRLKAKKQDIIDYSKNIENKNNYNGNEIDNNTFEPVNFNTNIGEKNKDTTVIDYIININNDKYLIDLENYYQKNMNNYMKKRKIKRLELSLKDNDINNFYKLNNIVGKNGIKFTFE